MANCTIERANPPHGVPSIITPPHPTPLTVEIRLAADRRSVLLIRDAAPPARLLATTLRAACRCAACRRAALDGTGAPPPAAITLTHLQPLGGQALNIAFSDGHDRGVFPFDYLDTLPSTPTEAAA